MMAPGGEANGPVEALTEIESGLIAAWLAPVWRGRGMQRPSIVVAGRGLAT
jgi:hypothetical protein